MIYVNCVVNLFSCLMPFFIAKKKMVSQPIIYKQRQRKVRKSGREGEGEHGDSNDLPASQRHKNIKLVLMTRSGLANS